MIEEIANDAKDEIDYLHDRIKHEIKASKEIGYQSDEFKKEQIRNENKEKIQRLREKHQKDLFEKQERLKREFDRQIANLKQDQEDLHSREKQSIKDRFKSKLALERERVVQNNNQLLEESGDIEHQVQLFSANLLGNKIEDQKHQQEVDYQKRIKEVEEQNEIEKNKARERARKDTKAKLERSRERELAKGSLHNNELEDAKDEAKREQQNYIRDKKRDVENNIRQTMREMRENFDQDIERKQKSVK